MNSTPASPATGANSARARAPEWDIAAIIVGLVLLAALSLFWVFSTLVVAGNCYPGACDEGQVAFTSTFSWMGMFAIAGATIAVSVVLRVFRRRAFFVPILGIVAVCAWGLVWNDLMGHALYG